MLPPTPVTLFYTPPRALDIDTTARALAGTALAGTALAGTALAGTALAATVFFTKLVHLSLQPLCLVLQRSVSPARLLKLFLQSPDARPSQSILLAPPLTTLV
jgi:hypothetical protein